MRTLAIILLLLVSLDLNINSHSNYVHCISHTNEWEWDNLINKLIQVESEGDSTAIGDGGKAVGILQIHPIMVREVNRILNQNKYSYEDRYSVHKSIEMFNIYQSKYNPDKDLELAAKLWNGGSTYYLRLDKVESYWKKVNKIK